MMATWRIRVRTMQGKATARLQGAGGFAVVCMLVGLAGLLVARRLVWAHYYGFSPYSLSGGELDEGRVLLALVALGGTLLVLALAGVLDGRAILAGGTAIAVAYVVLAAAFIVRSDTAPVCSADCGLRAFGPGPTVAIVSAAVYELGVVIASLVWRRLRRAGSPEPTGARSHRVRSQPILRSRHVAGGGESDA